ncbi:class I SAM-dependent methyltransferase [Yoonia sp. BS5-3]|uniref:Class I SAM-dependent methyltransferase n=1 Tax=Yoonia phaeophyticola TaxID=3137369 RepID=A0ABZ2V918_9RHOB
MGFSPDWLALREPVDHASRDAALLAQTVAAAGQETLVLDLGSGTGSTARAFAGHAPAAWGWRFVDGDAALLQIAGEKHPQSEQVLFDLGNIADLPLDGVGLVTASALLDLMPRDWVDALAARLSAAKIPFYAAINYNGQMRWSPASPDDAGVTAAFNQHQRSDKGIGAALGPISADETAQIFAAHGFDVHRGDSPWQLGADDTALHDELIAGIGAAAAEAGYKDALTWAEMRRRTVAQTTGYIGHTDILAIPHLTGE